MKKIEYTSNKSLEKSLNLVNRLMIKNLDFAYTKTIVLNESQTTYTYPVDSQAAINEINHEDSILPEIQHKEYTFTAYDHPFKGLSPEIKFYVSTPLISSTKNTLGFLLLLDTKDRLLSTEDTSYIEDFAKIIADTIEKDQASQKLQQVFTDYMHKAIHDLKNPLTSISLTSELLKRKAEDPKMVISFCERLEKANQRLFANLEKLKFSFPVEDNHFKLVINEINLDELLSDIKSTANKININTENKIEKNIYADYNRLKEAIILLIGYIHPTEDSNVIMKCYSKDKQAIIQFSSPRSNFDNQDTNLTISKTLIEMHGGKTETDGNSFVIYLPSENL